MMMKMKKKIIVKMAKKSYVYGGFKEEIRKLLRKRITIKHKIRYHLYKTEDLKGDLIKTEEELDKYLKQAGN